MVEWPWSLVASSLLGFLAVCLVSWGVVRLSYEAYNGWSFVQMFSSCFSQGRRQRGVSTGGQGSPSSSEGLTFSNIGPRVPSITVAYSGRRVSDEPNPIFEENDSYPEGGTYMVLIPLNSLKIARRKDLRWLQVRLEPSSPLHQLCLLLR